MLIVVLLVLLAIATGILGFLIKSALWLLFLTALFLVAAYLVGRSHTRSR